MKKAIIAGLHEIGARERVGLVGCVKSKRHDAAPAMELYTSPLFRWRRAAVERSCGRWFVLSAKHGLVDPDAVLAPYEATLKTASRDERRRWSAEVLNALVQRVGSLVDVAFEIHADSAYRDFGLVAGLRALGASVEIPAAGLTQGRALAFYRERLGLLPRIEIKSSGAAAPEPVTTRVSREKTPPPPGVPADIVANPAAVVGALLAYQERLATERRGKPPFFSPNPEANQLVIEDPFAFLLGVVFDQGVRFERAWTAPYELRRRLGHLDARRMAAEPEALREAMSKPSPLHRFHKMARWIAAAARKVTEDYEGDAGRLWGDEPSAREVQDRLDAFLGIGQKKAAMAVDLLVRYLGIGISQLSGSDVALDVHVRRTLLRTGLAERDEPSHMIEAARRLHPTRPGEIDSPLWEIGRQWCRPARPDCAACAITIVCPKLVSRGDAVRGN